MPCHCGLDTVEVCSVCAREFCVEHQSPVDPKFCSDCLTVEGVELQKEPLIDAEGVKHNGFHVTNFGPAYKTHARLISDMSDSELEEHILDLKKKVKDAEAILDHTRVRLNMAVMEGGDRSAAEQRRLRSLGYKPLPTNPGAADPTRNKKMQATVSKLKMLAAAMGKIISTPEEIADFVKFLKAAQDAANKGKVKS